MAGTASRAERLLLGLVLSSCGPEGGAPTASASAAAVAPAGASGSSAEPRPTETQTRYTDGDARVKSLALEGLDPKQPDAVERLSTGLAVCVPMGSDLPPELSHCSTATLSFVAYRLGEACALQGLEERSRTAMRIARAVEPERALAAATDPRVKAAFDSSVSQSFGGGGTRRPPSLAAKSRVERALGALTPADIEAALASARPSVLGCYASVIGEMPDLAGSVSFDAKISAGGRVELTQQRATLPNQAAVSCIARVTRAMKLPEAKSETVAELGWQLSTP